MVGRLTHNPEDAITLAHNHGADNFAGQLHILLALGIMAAYFAVPFTALRRLPLTTAAKISGSLFFITCAMTHLAIAARFHDSGWMILNDAVQFAATVTFLTTLSRQVAWTLKRRQDRDRQRPS